MHAVDHPSQIAIVCDTVPYPNRSGDNQRIAELISVLRAQGWFVHLVLCGFLDGRQKRLCRSHVDALHVYAGTGWRRRTRNGLRRTVRTIDRWGKTLGMPPAEELAGRILGRSLTPLVLDYWQRYPAGLDAFTARLADCYPLKAVIIEYIWLYRAAALIGRGTARLLDTHDLQHKRCEEFASRGMVFPLNINRDDEARIFRGFDSVIAIQAEEAKLIRAMCPELRVLTVGSCGTQGNPNGDLPVSGRVLYVGGYNGANIDGLRRFLEHVWPRVRARCPQAHLRVCGYVYRAFNSAVFDNVEFAGHVQDVETEYAQAAVVINPSWIGTGLKIKSVEALTRGKPLVTTTKGIEGLPDDAKLGAQVCDNDETFASRTAQLLSDGTARQRAAAAARSFAEAHLNQQTVYKELVDFLTEAR